MKKRFKQKLCSILLAITMLVTAAPIFAADMDMTFIEDAEMETFITEKSSEQTVDEENIEFSQDPFIIDSTITDEEEINIPIEQELPTDIEFVDDNEEMSQEIDYNAPVNNENQEDPVEQNE